MSLETSLGEKNMKITEKKIERICDLRYNGVKVIPIALNENISEKLVRTILIKYYTPTYVKIRDMAQPGYTPWGDSQSNGKPVVKTDKRYDEGYAHQDANCRVPEHQRLLERIKEKEQPIETDKENDQTKDLQLQQKKEDIEDTLKEIQRLTQINKEHEKKDKDYEAVIQKKDQDILYLKYINLSGIQGIQNDISDIKIKFNTGITAVREDIGTLTKAHSQLNLSFQTHNTTTLEKIKLEQELQTLKEKHSNDLMKYGGVGVIGFGAGMLVDRFFPSLLDSFVTWIKEQIKNTNAGYTDTPIPQPGIIHPDIHYIYSGVNPGTNTSGTLCSGSFPTTYGEVHITGFNTVPNQQEGVIQPGLHSEVNLVTNPSGSQCSGAFYSSHAEIVPIQNVTPIQNSPPLLIPAYSYIPLTPPNDPSDSPLMKQILKTSGKQFHKHMERFFKHQGYRILQTMLSCDKGADLVIERDGIKIVVQLKQQKEKIGLHAIQEVFAALKFYDATYARVVITSEFTKSAAELGQKLDVELWDGKRLLEELYKHQFFCPPA